jgi:hypothetical protein
VRERRVLARAWRGRGREILTTKLHKVIRRVAGLSERRRVVVGLN